MLLDVCAPFVPLIILSVWEQLQKSDLPPAAEDMAKWEAEFSQMMNDQRNMDFDYDTMGLSQWENPSPPFQSLAFDSDGIPLLGDYEFGLPFPHSTDSWVLRYENREKQSIHGRTVRKDPSRTGEGSVEREWLIV